MFQLEGSDDPQIFWELGCPQHAIWKELLQAIGIIN
jgi:hypothetical protein